MKKKIGIAVVCLIVSLLVGMSLVGCSKVNKLKPDGENLAKNATYTYGEKTSSKFRMTKTAKEVKITFPQEVEINTVVLNESTNSVFAFEFWTNIDEKPKLIYKQDEINGVRYCYLDNIKVTEMTIKAFALENFVINRFEAYNVVRKQNDFRITAYLPVGEFLGNIAINEANTSTVKNDVANLEGLKHVTDIILFGIGNYDESGNISYDTNAFNKTMQVIRQVRGDRMPKMYVNFVMASKLKDENNMKDRFFPHLQKLALEDNCDKLVKNLSDFVIENGLDGIGFDYEFPYTFNDYAVYGKFLIKLKEAMPTKLISIAVAPWGLKFSKKAIEAVDFFELMCYDLKDARGNHSGWRLGLTDAISYVDNLGIPLKKVNVGVPFYSRPIDYGNYWGGWKSECDQMSEFSNYIATEFISTEEWSGTFNVKPRWYNGVNMIQDKTAFAYDSGIGGMMIWHFNCDTDYSHPKSLIKAMNNVFD